MTNNKATIDEIRELVCKQCGTEIFKKSAQTPQFCSVSCKGKYNYKRNGQKYRARQLKQYRERSVKEQVYINARGRALQSGIPFTITLEDIPEPTAYCPITKHLLFRSKGLHVNTSPSLDRIDNSKGYVPGNVRIISYRANSRKGDLSLEEIERLYLYSKGLLNE